VACAPRSRRDHERLIEAERWVPAFAERFGTVANLDGTAVTYTAEADGLIAPDGRFR
jgi:hypothetical protein